MKQKVKYPSDKLPKPVKPYASINVEKDYDNNEITVVAQVLMDRLVDGHGKEIEGAAFGLALDGSRSMKELYGTGGGPFGGTPNVVEPVAKSMLNFLAGFSGTGEVDLAYWAVGPGGKEVEGVGSISASNIGPLKIKPSKTMGGSTYLLPIVKHFIEDKLSNAPWAMAIIITDGLIDDMEDVKKYTEKYAVAVDAGKQKLIKLVLIGLGEHVDAGQLEELDNFEASVDVDVWSSKMASEMEELHEVFDEVMSENLILAPSGKVLDNKGNVLAVFNDGLPARIEFKLNSTSNGFKLEVPGQTAIEQDLSEAIALLK